MPTPPQTTLVALNAQYIHTGLGVRTIAAYVRGKTSLPLNVLEYTINNHHSDVLQGLYKAQADMYLFSCYLWNIEMVLRLARDLRQLRPGIMIGLGGPQVTYQAEAYLQQNPAVDFVLRGEGEDTVLRLMELLSSKEALCGCPGITYRNKHAICATTPRPQISMDEMGFAYPDIADLPHRIIYYESIRGCPFACSYCTSSIERGVRKRSLSLVFDDLSVFLAHRVPQVKFVDRTFNCDRHHARGIWEWLVTHDNGITNFHFELAGELLDEDTIEFLSQVRPGLFQFEIGVQSTHGETLCEINRPADIASLFGKVQRLLAPGNIHIHLDLIAGLPYEDYQQFQVSFNDVYGCKPHQFQLGFLKVLSGSKMEGMAASYQLSYSQNAPFEVLSTRWLSYDQLTVLHGIAHMVDVYYNTARFSNVLGYLLPQFDTPFAFYHALWLHFDRETQGKPLSQLGYYDLLYSFVLSQHRPVTEEMQWLAKYDLLLHEKPRKIPKWIAVNGYEEHRAAIQRFFMNEQNIATYLPEYIEESSLRIERTAHLEVFPFHPISGVPGMTPVLFNYRRRDVVGLAHVHILAGEDMAAATSQTL